MSVRIVLSAALLLIWACSDGSASSTTVTAAPTTSSSVASTTTPENPPTTVPAPTTFPTTSTAPVTVVVAGGVLQTPLRHEVALGEVVTIEITADIADEAHLHTYDLYVDVAPDVAATMEFSATIPGIFEMELESTHLQILELVVQ